MSATRPWSLDRGHRRRGGWRGCRDRGDPDRARRPAHAVRRRARGPPHRGHRDAARGRRGGGRLPGDRGLPRGGARALRARLLSEAARALSDLQRWTRRSRRLRTSWCPPGRTAACARSSSPTAPLDRSRPATTTQKMPLPRRCDCCPPTSTRSPSEDCWTARSPHAVRWWSRTSPTAGLSPTTAPTTEQLGIRSIAIAPLIDHGEVVRVDRSRHDRALRAGPCARTS